ncbi:MAG: hypothetical protein R2862_00725 [Thermoanaerobaculia bacterium]
MTSPMVNQTNPRDAAAQGAWPSGAQGEYPLPAEPDDRRRRFGNPARGSSYDPDARQRRRRERLLPAFDRQRRHLAYRGQDQRQRRGRRNLHRPVSAVALGRGRNVAVAVGYYSRQNDTANNLLLDYYSRVSYDGGVTWQPSTRLSDVSSSIVLDPNLATCYHGDYDTNIHRVGAAQYLWSDDRPSPGTGHADPNIYSESTPAGIDYLLVPGNGSQQLCTTAGSAVYPVDLFQFQGFNESVTLSLPGERQRCDEGLQPELAAVPGSSTLTVGNSGRRRRESTR